MSLAIDLHRRREYPTREVVAWLRSKGWKIVTLASGAQMASPQFDEQGVFDLMDAVLREVCREIEDLRRLPGGRRATDEELFG